MATMLRGGRGSGFFGIGIAGALSLLAGCSHGSSGGSSSGAASTATPAATAATVHVPLSAPRALHTATLLPSGAVLVAGGVDASGTPSAATFLVTETAVTAGPSLASARIGHTATLLATGKVLIAGGENGTAAGSVILDSTEIYDPVAGSVSPGPGLLNARMEATAVAYGTASAQHVLIAGGSNGSAAIAACEEYDVTAGSMNPVGSLSEARSSASSGMLDNGTVVVVGGDAASGPAGAELFNPATNAFTPVTMSVPATGGAFAAIGADAIYAGGQTAAGDQAASEVYNETAQVFSTGPSLLSARRDATASVVGNEIVFVGGRNGTTPVAAVEVINGNPQTSAVSAAMSLNVARYGHSATALSNGHVLVVGGVNSSGQILESIEEVDPANTTVTRAAQSAPTTTTTTTVTTTIPSPSPSPVTTTTTTTTTTGTTSSSGGLLGTIGSLLGSLFGGSSSSSSSSGGIGSAIGSVLGGLLGGSSSTSSSGTTTSSSSGVGSAIGSVVNALIGGGTNTQGSGGIGGVVGNLLGGLLGGSSSSGGGLGGLLGSLFGGSSSSSSSSGSSTTTTPSTTNTGSLQVVSINTQTGSVGTLVQVLLSGAGTAVGAAMDNGQGVYTNVTNAQAFQNGNYVEIDFNVPQLASGNYYVDLYSFSSSAANATVTGQAQVPFQVQ